MERDQIALSIIAILVGIGIIIALFLTASETTQNETIPVISDTEREVVRETERVIIQPEPYPVPYPYPCPYSYMPPEDEPITNESDGCPGYQ